MNIVNVLLLLTVFFISAVFSQNSAYDQNKVLLQGLTTDFENYNAQEISTYNKLKAFKSETDTSTACATSGQLNSFREILEAYLKATQDMIKKVQDVKSQPSAASNSAIGLLASSITDPLNAIESLFADALKALSRPTAKIILNSLLIALSAAIDPSVALLIQMVQKVKDAPPGAEAVLANLFLSTALYLLSIVKQLHDIENRINALPTSSNP